MKLVLGIRRILLFLLIVLSVGAQSTDGDLLATAKTRRFTAADLSPEGQKAYAGRNLETASVRSNLLSQMIAEELLDMEAKAANSSREKLLEAQRAKVSEPAAAQIQAVYDANRQALGNRPLDAVRKDIVAFLRRDPEQKAVNDYVSLLQTKFKYVAAKNVNAADLKPMDLLATIGTRQISVREFETRHRLQLNAALHHQYEHFRSDLEVSILNALVEEEAKAKSTDASGIIAAEVTDKMREFSDAERERLETALMDRLFAKYEVKILLKEPEIIAQNVSVDDDPSVGPVTASVTVVMFSDFQCPACARTHPVLKQVIAEFGDKVRLVVRDYPLEHIHENAIRAAIAANAAAKQGKYFEFIELLYRNQDSLDPLTLMKYAREVGLNAKQFEIDSDDAKTAAEIRKDKVDGDSYGVSGTPTIFVNGVEIHSLSAGAFRRAINRALAK